MEQSDMYTLNKKQSTMSKWCVTPKPRPNADVKLICFPYAGGGVSVFYPWVDLLPDNVELNIIQLPGRGSHFSAEPIADMTSLVESLFSELAPILHSDYIIFGHSLGSRIGFELIIRAIRVGLKPPLHFFASGSAGPQRKCFDRKVYELPDVDFIQELKDMKGTPAEILENKELIELHLPMLRSDFKVAGEYSYKGNVNIPSPVTVLFGKDDAISDEEIHMWGMYFSDFSKVECSGGHFFIDTHPHQVIAQLNLYFETQFAINAA